MPGVESAGESVLHLDHWVDHFSSLSSNNAVSITDAAKQQQIALIEKYLVAQWDIAVYAGKPDHISKDKVKAAYAVVKWEVHKTEWFEAFGIEDASTNSQLQSTLETMFRAMNAAVTTAATSNISSSAAVAKTRQKLYRLEAEQYIHAQSLKKS